MPQLKLQKWSTPSLSKESGEQEKVERLDSEETRATALSEEDKRLVFDRANRASRRARQLSEEGERIQRRDAGSRVNRAERENLGFWFSKGAKLDFR